MKNHTKMFWCIYKISYKPLVGAKLLRIRFDKFDSRLYNGTRYLVLLEDEKYVSIDNRIRYLTGVGSIITYVVSYNYLKIKVDSYNFLPLEKTLTFHNVIILIKSVFNKDKNNYYYNIFLEEVSN